MIKELWSYFMMVRDLKGKNECLENNSLIL